MKAVLRARQFSELLFSRRFISIESLNESVRNSYLQPKDVAFFKERALDGLMPNELEAVEAAEKIIKAAAARPTALVVGCGTGRECFALDRRNFKVTGYDTSAKMIELAKTLSARGSETEFSLELPATRFDLLLVTVNLMNQIAGRKNRVAILSRLRALSHARTVLLIESDTDGIRATSLPGIAARILRIRSRLHGWDWEHGDAVRSCAEGHLIYHHYYSSIQEMRDELEEAGWRGRSLPKGFHICASIAES